MSTRFYYVSDIHTEFHNNTEYSFWPELPEGQNVLLCAGDIGLVSQETYWKFFTKACSKFYHIYTVLGNHEYYSSRQDAPDVYSDKLKNMTNRFKRKRDELGLKNLTLLENTRVDLHDCVLLGTTLWSQIPKVAEQYITQVISDYRKISYFATSVSNTLNSEAVKFLETNLAECQKQGKKCIVMTHHAPSFQDTSAPEHTGQMSNYAFANKLDHLIEKSTYWVYGHTHWNNTTNPKLKSNQLGYDWVNPCKGFDKNAWFEL